jgi:hypothetical protein
LIALVASIAIGCYVVIPELLFRLLFSKFIPLRSITRTHSEELGRSLFTIAIPLLLAIWAVRTVPVVKQWPFAFPDTSEMRKADYQTVASGIYSESLVKGKEIAFYESIGRSVRRQGRLLSWYYGFISIEGLLMGLAASRYGRFKHSTSRSKRHTAGIWLIEQFVIPKVSEWWVLLTPFTLPQKDAKIIADILMTDGVLYSGTVYQHFLTSDGKLSGVILVDPKRYDRQAYLADKDKGTQKGKETYWKPIPSARIYMLADKIVNLNVNYSQNPPDADIVKRYVEARIPKASHGFSIEIKINPEAKS